MCETVNHKLLIFINGKGKLPLLNRGNPHSQGIRKWRNLGNKVNWCSFFFLLHFHPNNMD